MGEQDQRDPKMTTVKVPVAVRDELRRRAVQQGTSQAAVIADLLERSPSAPYDVHALLDEIDADWGDLFVRLAQ